MKTKDELNILKEEVETLNKKLAGLTREELAQVTGGAEIENLGGRMTVVLAPEDDPFTVLMSLRIPPCIQPDYDSCVLLNTLAGEMRENGYTTLVIYPTINFPAFHIDSYELR